MNGNNLNSKLISFNKYAFISENLIEKCKEKVRAKDTFAFAELLMKLSIESEKNHIRIRNFFIENVSNKIQKKDFRTRLYTTMDISVSEKDNIICIRMPPLMHRTKTNESGKYEYANGINLPLSIALNDFAIENETKKYKEKVVIYVKNIVSFEAERRTIPDTDNYEYKDLVNTITLNFLPDDDFRYVSTYFESEIGNMSKTVIHIIPKKRFADFIEAEMLSKKKKSKAVSVNNDLLYFSPKKSA